MVVGGAGGDSRARKAPGRRTRWRPRVSVRGGAWCAGQGRDRPPSAAACRRGTGCGVRRRRPLCTTPFSRPSFTLLPPPTTTTERTYACRGAGGRLGCDLETEISCTTTTSPHSGGAGALGSRDGATRAPGAAPRLYARLAVSLGSAPVCLSPAGRPRTVCAEVVGEEGLLVLALCTRHAWVPALLSRRLAGAARCPSYLLGRGLQAPGSPVRTAYEKVGVPPSRQGQPHDFVYRVPLVTGEMTR